MIKMDCAVKPGRFHDPTTWASGVVPCADSVLFLNGCPVTIDADSEFRSSVVLGQGFGGIERGGGWIVANRDDEFSDEPIRVAFDTVLALSDAPAFGVRGGFPRLELKGRVIAYRTEWMHRSAVGPDLLVDVRAIMPHDAPLPFVYPEPL